MDLAVLGAQSHQASRGPENQSLEGSAASAKFAKNVNKVYSKGLEREDELEADRIGIQLSAKAGYDPYAFINVLQAFQSQEQNGNEDFFKLISTHPSAETRLAELEPILIKLERYALEMRLIQRRFMKNTRY